MADTVDGTARYNKRWIFWKCWRVFHIFLFCVSSAVVNKGTDEEFTVTGFRRSWIRTLFSGIITILLLGIPNLIGRWKPNWKLLFTSCQCKLKFASRWVATKIFFGVFLDLNNIFQGVDSKNRNRRCFSGRCLWGDFPLCYTTRAEKHWLCQASQSET